jgi:hypothetical protein
MDAILTEQEIIDHANSFAVRAIKLYESGQLPHPDETEIYLPLENIHIFNHLRIYSTGFLGFNNITPDNKEATHKNLSDSARTVIMWISQGADIIKSESGTLILGYPHSYYLQAFAGKNTDNIEVINAIHQAFYLLCLHHLCDFYDQYHALFFNEDKQQESNLLKESSILTINALASLMNAQSAAEFGFAALERSAGIYNLEQERTNSQIKLDAAEFAAKQKNILAEFGRGKPKIDEHNKQQAEDAEKKWSPLVKECVKLMDAGISKREASRRVAEKNGVKKGTLSNIINKYK